ncbi:UNVERIFIED_ORG: hypothetical protein EDC92_1472 [Dietzia maris]|jgi:hypothetical protein|uniref:hypothetical protein n=1 Tax=Mycobacteriales TaxID=85007 RepID=UPI001048E125|nr:MULTISPECIES: hypothetical protein [Mycobacteriales]MBB0992218.1 hypothetical protein [Dietzia sp. SLG510A3-30A2]MBB0994999.1 hypothetical protein [Dietzia sp. SLG510A3-40A3]MBB1010373.1 hypothetical protein [Dietzia sp. SLG510A3-3B2-2]MCT2138632.1 transcriptional regulator [Dietzia cinnamea]
MNTEPTAAQLIELVVAIPGVAGIEPGIGTSLRALDARIRRTGPHATHFGLHVDHSGGTVTVEVSLDRSRPIRDTVQDIQHTLHNALAATAPESTQWKIRVQSLTTN